MYKEILSILIAIIFTYMMYFMINNRECIVINDKNN